MRYESRPGDYGYEVVEDPNTIGPRVIAQHLSHGMADAIAWMLNMVTNPKIHAIEAIIDSGETAIIEGQEVTLFDFEKFDLEPR